MNYLVGYSLKAGQMLIPEFNLISARDRAKNICYSDKETNSDSESVKIFDIKTFEVIEAYVFNKATNKVEKQSTTVSESDRFLDWMMEER